MRALRLFFIVLSGLIYPAAGHAQVVYHQVYHLISLEGKPVSISLSYKLFSKRLAVSCASDTLFLLDSPGTESVLVLKHHFLQINYETRCGSGCRTQNTALISVRRQKLKVSLLVESLAESEGFTPGSERTYHYRVTLAMPGTSANPYTIQARVHEEERFQRTPSQNHTLNQQVTLHWDAINQVFYSGLEPTARCLPVFDEDGKYPVEPSDLSALNLIQPDVYIPYYPIVPQWIAGAFPVIRLKNHLYYFIQGEWYTGPEKQDPDRSYWFSKGVEYVPSRERK